MKPALTIAAYSLGTLFIAAPLPGVAQERPGSRPEITQLWRSLSANRVPTISSAKATERASVYHSDGSIRHWVPSPGRQLSATGALTNDAEQSAHRFLRLQAEAFGLHGASVEFKRHQHRNQNGHHYLRFKQTFAGLPVYGGQAVVQLNARGDVEYAANYLERGLHVFEGMREASTPSMDAGTAQARTRAAIQSRSGGQSLTLSAPVLVWYSPSAVGMRGAPRLAWMLVVEDSFSAIHDRVFVGGHAGEILDRIPLGCEILHRSIFNANNNQTWPPSFPPPLPARIEFGPGSSDGEVNEAWDGIGDAYNFYRNRHGRNGIGGSDQPIFSIVRVCVANQTCPWPNAAWSGLPEEVPSSIFGFNINEGILTFGQGWAKDDVVAHEFTHGVTQFESGLQYRNASGAINEALSDIWGEFVDWGNGRGNDSPGVRWDVGEDLSGGRIRNMRNPPTNGNPDRLSSTLVTAPTASPTPDNDQGGVHSNSGIVNKLCYLLTDGDTFNGYTVNGLGMDRIARVFYEVNANLLGQNADYTDLSVALHQAAANLGWSQSERANLHNACLAVEIVGNYVDRANGNSSPNGCRQAGIGVGGPFPKVSEGANALQSGDTLFVRGGNYNQTVRITKPMRLINYNGTAVIGRP
ncbi:MAG: M4 family metallopeptidase [Akkermansiaceae bacterium]|nr:M4 family metallopeptidase [Verrucomicrobiales bacterium]